MITEELKLAAAEKVAGGSSLKTIGKLVAFSTIAVGTGIFIEKMLDHLDTMRIKAKSPEYYKRMIEAHPELKKEDPEAVARFWASLYHFAPSMAQDPIASGAFIRQSIRKGLYEEFGGPPPDTYATLGDIEGKLRRDPYTEKSLLKGIIGGVGASVS